MERIAKYSIALTGKQESPDGPRSLTLIFERAIAWGGGGKAVKKKNYEKFLHVRIVQEASIHQSHVS